MLAPSPERRRGGARRCCPGRDHVLLRDTLTSHQKLQKSRTTAADEPPPAAAEAAAAEAVWLCAADAYKPVTLTVWCSAGVRGRGG